MQDLTFVLGMNRSGSEMWQHLGSAGINIQAACMFPRLEGRVAHVTISDEDADRAQQILIDAGFIPMDRRSVVIGEFTDAPGGLGELSRRLDDAGVQIYIMYMATGDRVVIGADDLAKAAEVI